MFNCQGKIIDTHTHIYPEKIAAKATAAVGAFYDYPMESIGTAETLKEHMQKAGVCKSFILSVATVPKQVRGINDFLIATVKNNPDIFVPFGTGSSRYGKYRRRTRIYQEKRHIRLKIPP